MDPVYRSSVLLRTWSRSVPLEGADGATVYPPLVLGPDLPEAERLLNEGHLPPRLRVLQVLGRGASATVFAVEDLELGRQIAVKLHPAGGDRYLHEVRVVSRLDHPGILPLYDAGHGSDGSAWLSMPVHRGTSLSRLLETWQQEGRPPEVIATVGQRVDVLIQVAAALVHAHSQGVVHHDVKPGNMVVGSQGEAVLVDWGAATLAVDRAQGARPQQGTPAYMAPEQARREACAEGSDIYALGATLFHVLLGRPPFLAEDPQEFWQGKRSGRLHAPGLVERFGLPPALLAIAARALQPEATERYHSMADLLADLRAYRDGRRVLAWREGVLNRYRRWYRQHRVATLGILFLGALILALSVALVREQLARYSSWQLVADPAISLATGQAWFEPAQDPSGRVVVPLDLPLEGGGVPVQRRAEGLQLNRQGAQLPAGTLVWQCPLRVGGAVRIAWNIHLLGSLPGLQVQLGNDQQALRLQWRAGNGQREQLLLSSLDPSQPSTQRRLAAAWQEGARGGKHRLVLQREDERLQCWVDDQLCLDYRDPFLRWQAGSAQLSLHITDPGPVLISDLHIWRKPLARLLSPLALGHEALGRGDAEQALYHYQQLTQAYAGGVLDDEARFYAGLASALAGRPAAAREWVAPLVPAQGPLPARLAVLLARCAQAEGKLAQAFGYLERADWSEAQARWPLLAQADALLCALVRSAPPPALAGLLATSEQWRTKAQLPAGPWLASQELLAGELKRHGQSQLLEQLTQGSPTWSAWRQP